MENATYDALGAADVAIVSSGTATVETALIGHANGGGLPRVALYRLDWQAPGEDAFRRHGQPDRRQKSGARTDSGRLHSRARCGRGRAATGSAEIRGEMRRDLAQVRERLGPPGAIERAADIIAGMIAEH